MEVKYNLTGPARKALVKAIENITGEKAIYKKVPSCAYTVAGYTITKDPKATVLAGSEECWLFVKIEKSANFDQYLTYTPATGWELVTGTDNVYARKVTTADFGTAFSVLQNDQVTVKGTVTEGMMTSLTTASYPTLTITAYATQLHKSATEDFTAVDAWAAASTL